MSSRSDDWISAAEAARRLHITRPTLYAYVSRGFVRSQAGTGPSRARRYASDDIERLRRRAEERRDPDKVAAHAMQWGLPVLESAITLIAGGKLYYRGRDAIALARSESVGQVASLIWTGDSAAPFAAERQRIAGARALAARPFVAGAHAALAEASVTDDAGFDLRPAAVARTGWHIMHLLARAAVSRQAPVKRSRTSGRRTSSSSASQTIDEQLASGWGVRGAAVDVIRAALILSADHELNVSAFTARCVASAGATPYAVVTAALAALEGVRHGGSTSRMEALLASLRHTRNRRAAFAERLRLGEPLAGFGHPLYPNGDPRAAALLALLHECFPKSAELAFVRDAAEAGARLTHDEPNLDFALAAVSRVLALPAGSGFVLFGTGRTIGWIGHAIEQYATGQLIRPRAKYVGVVPGA
jgi:citrate synthase